MSDIIALSHKLNLNNIRLDEIILQVQNTTLFLIATGSLFCCVNHHLNNYQLESSINNFNILNNFVAYYSFIDLFINNSIEVKMHHLFTLFIVFYKVYYNIPDFYSFEIMYPYLKTEISSIFFVFKYWLPKNTTIYTINDIIFYMMFLKLRLYDIYYEVLVNKNVYEMLQIYSSSNHLLSSIILLGCFGLYILNVYWFLIMTKVIYKKLAKIININTEVMSHYLCSYIFFFNVPLAVYIYSYNKNEKYIFDMIGITSLSVSSYIYHYDVYNRLHTKQIENHDVPDKENAIIFLNDCSFIQIRSFFTTITSFYGSPYFLAAISISSACHIVSFYNCIINILELFIHDDRKKHFLQIHNLLNAFTIAVDVILISMNSKLEIAVPFLLVNITAGLLFIVDPFYKLTHFLFHIFLIMQTYFLCLSHSSK